MAIQITEKEKKILVKVVVLGAVMFGLVWAGERYVNQFTVDERSLNETLRTEEADFRTRLSQIQDEERLQNQFVESYRRYQEQGLILGNQFAEDSEFAAEQDEIFRLVLLERLQEIQRDRKFFNFVSRMTKPSNLPSSFSEYTSDSQVAVRTNLMNIQMPMLHSLDMLMLLNDFYDEETNRFVPVRCAIGRTVTYTGNPEDLLNSDAKLSGECDLVWLTIFDPLQGEVTGASSVEETSTDG